MTIRDSARRDACHPLRHGFVERQPSDALIGLIAAEFLTIPATLLFGRLANMRWSGIAISREIPAALVGGTAPLVATWLVAVAGGTPWLVAGYLVALSVIGLVGICFLPETLNRTTVAGSSTPATRNASSFDDHAEEAARV